MAYVSHFHRSIPVIFCGFMVVDFNSPCLQITQALIAQNWLVKAMKHGTKGLGFDLYYLSYVEVSDEFCPCYPCLPSSDEYLVEQKLYDWHKL